ncbi:MarR family winged helix-turn-helix transcriptional regulator [Streptomyces sp. NPDC090306]|uniref:MarR family winged helix-turn-helix transcriptional regulator n=1 Tax=unclassified Streptomyces TaxID=2593676 RepID=UPI0036E87448
MADAVDDLVALWFAASDDAAPRLPARQLHALRTVRHRPELNLTALAEDLGVGLPTASRLCDRLVAAGLLERQTQPHSRREVQLVVTADGRRLLADVTELRSRRLAAALRDMTQSQCADLGRGLAAFRRAAHAADGRAPREGTAR